MKLTIALFLIFSLIPIGKTMAWEQDFVYTEGSKLMLNGEEYYFSAANSYEMIYGTASADAIFQQAEALGVNAIRIWGFWNDPNQAGALQKKPGEFPEHNWKKFDYILWKAEQMGIKLIIPLANYWKEFGGIDYYVNYSDTANTPEDFYTDANTIQMYKNYVSYVLNRENTYKNGKKYKDDPTVMIWELMNEPRGKSDTTGHKVYNWLNDMAKYVHELDPQRKQLVASGEEGFFKDKGTSYDTPAEGSFFDKNGASSEIDVLSFHLWPINWGKDANAEAFIEEWISTHKSVADTLNKPTYMGEFGWQINRTANSTIARRNEIFDWTYKKALQYNLPGTGFWVLTLNQDENHISGGELKFPVLVPGDASTNAIIKSFSDNVTSPYTKVSDLKTNFNEITPGASAILTWSTRFADSVTLNGQLVANNGSISVSPSSTQVYTLEAYGEISQGIWGSTSRDITIVVSPARASAITLSSSLSSIAFGERVNLGGEILDQMGNHFSTHLNWSVNGGGILANTSGQTTTFISDGSKGNFAISAKHGNLEKNLIVEVGEKKINDSELNFSAGWNRTTGEGKFQNDDHYSYTEGASYLLDFYGTGITIFGPKAPHHGTGWVSINGAQAQAANFNSALTELDTEIWSSGTLNKGWHTLEMRVGNNGVIVADRFEVTSDEATADINDTFYSFSNGWNTSIGKEKYRGDDHYTGQAGASYTLSFLGTKAQLFAPTASHHGTASLRFNGQSYSINFSSSERVENALIWESPEVAYGSHTITVTANGDGVIVADKARITKRLPSQIHNDDSFSYFGTWNKSTGSGKYQNDDQYSAEGGASFEVSSFGTKLKLYGPVASHHGSATVYIDGVNVGTADFSNTTRIANTLIWESAMLSRGNHSLRVVSKGTGVIVADRVEAYDIFENSDTQGSLTLEAESANLSTGLQIDATEGNFSGTGYVTGFNESGEELSWEFSVSESRDYQIKIRYASGYGTKYNSLYLNDSKDSLAEFTDTNDFSTWRTVEITRFLQAGNNKVAIKMDDSSWGWVNIDTIIIE